MKLIRMYLSNKNDKLSIPRNDTIDRICDEIESCSFEFPSGDTIISIVDSGQFMFLESFFNKWYTDFSIIDISSKAIKEEKPEIEDQRLQDIYNEYRKMVLTVNDVLDKILEKGIDSLSDIDRSVLVNSTQ